MTAVKLDSKITTYVEKALEGWAAEMFAKRGGHWPAVIELAHVERAEPAETEDKQETVKLRITQLEVPGPDHQEKIREVLKALYTVRTAEGTLDDENITGYGIHRDNLRRAADDLIWPPRPGDLWRDDEGRPWFAVETDDYIVRLVDEAGRQENPEVLVGTRRLKLVSRVRKTNENDRQGSLI
ncbi:hypothetical protein [Thermoactinospora rubra]|uniref:hypothetical protein n=1 Tax=Thermoactinospora rubra TaxID=1088767 RepID=UPI00197F7D92|nr:hypothetical protein [Thermoactinospora rubra]